MTLEAAEKVEQSTFGWTMILDADYSQSQIVRHSGVRRGGGAVVRTSF